MGHSISSYATISTAVRIIGACKPHHYVKVGLPFGGGRGEEIWHYLLHSQTVLRQVTGTRTEDNYPTYCDVYGVCVNSSQAKYSPCS